MKKIEYKKGMCPMCANENIEYMEHDYNDHYLWVSAICPKCETRITEQYNLVFTLTTFYNGSSIIKQIEQGDKVKLELKK